MHRFLGGLVLVLAAGAAVAGDNARLEDLVKNILTTLDKLSGTLTTIRDEDTAKAAVPELKKAAADYLDLRKKAENAQPPSKEEKDKLAKQYKVKLEEATKKLLAEVTRVQGVAGGKEALKEISGVLAKKKKDKSKEKDQQ